MTKERRKKNNEAVAIQVAVVTIIINVLLAVGKLLTGILSDSEAMIADAVHSFSDVFSTVIVIIGIKMASKASDKSHPFGHERFECVAAIVLAVLLAGTGVILGYEGIVSIVKWSGAEDKSAFAVPGLAALIMAGVSVAVKEGMYWYTRWAAKKAKSDALAADAWHHRSDALSSIGAFIGVILAMTLGIAIFDSIASLVICVLIIVVAVNIFRRAVGKMVDKSCDEETLRKMKDLTTSIDGVIAIDVIRTRVFGNKIYVEIEISVDGELTLISAHSIAETVHEKIEQEFPDVKHCMVHVNPYIYDEA